MAAAYQKFTGELQASILKWADPTGRMVKSPTRVSKGRGHRCLLGRGARVCLMAYPAR